MDEDRIDLSSLDPTGDRERFERAIQSIQAVAQPELLSRRQRSNPLAQLVQLRKPMLAAASLAAIISAGVLLRVRIPETSASTDVVAEALGVPSVLAIGVRQERVPTLSELFAAFEENR
ncbi:MAG: hypothetical protein JSW71_03880 [Gemmatimonadota bacterium]|nr:MAG: hypothetical protein JSW71_03880 [Gemmatimonadota bacterium]